MPFWQGATRRRLNACNEEQRGQGGAARFDRVRSAVTQEVKAIVGANVRIHAVWPAETSGQLRFLGSMLSRAVAAEPRGSSRQAIQHLMERAQ